MQFELLTSFFVQKIQNLYEICFFYGYLPIVKLIKEA